MAIHPNAALGDRSPAVLQYLQYVDVVLVTVSLVLALALGAPALGCALGAGGWIIQRVIAAVDGRWTRKLADPFKRLCVGIFEAFGRIWLLAGVIILAGVLGQRPDGLAAALFVFGGYSIAFVVKVITGPPARRAVR